MPVAPTTRDPREMILEFFPSEHREDPRVESLALIFKDFICGADLGTRLDAFIDLREWTNERTPLIAGVTPLETVLTLLETRRELRAGFQQGALQILTETRSVELFAEAGLHPREGLWSEAARRLVEEVLPSPREDTDLSRFVFRLYPTRQAIDRLVTQPDEMFERIVRAISPVDDASAWVKQREDLTQAFYLLAVHVVGIGLSPGLRARSHAGSIE